MKAKPWQTISSKIVHKTPWMCLREDKVNHPGGKGVYTYVDKLPAVFVIPITDRKEIYLIGQWRHPIRRYSWEFPCGGVEKKESLLAAAKRELLEEADLAAKSWRRIGHFYFANGGSNQMAVVFVARNIGPGHSQGQRDATEDLAIKKIKISTFERLVKSNKITDGPSIAAYYQAKLHLGL